MRVEIFRVPPKVGEWAQASAAYSFKPQHGDDAPLLAVQLPPGWILVGEPEPLLVRRTSVSDFTTRTATEVFYHSLAGGSEGFQAETPLDAPEEAASSILGTPEDALRQAPALTELPAPKPGRNGKPKLPARRT